MLVHISKSVLVKALQQVYRAVPSHSPNSLLSGLYIHADSEGIVFRGSNTSLTLQYKVDIQDGSVHVVRSGSIVCHAKYLYELVRKMNDDDVILEAKSQSMLHISAGGTFVRLSGMSQAEEFPSIVPPVSVALYPTVQVPSRLLISVIQQVVVAVSTSESRPILTGVSLVIQGERLTMIATDGIVRMATRTVAIKNEAGVSASVIVPGTNLLEISRLLGEDGDEPVTIQFYPHQIYFSTNRLCMQSALIEGKYPPTRDLVPSGYISEVTVNLSILRQTVDRVSVLAEQRLITLQASEPRLVLSADTSEIGDMCDGLAWESRSGEDFRITVNGKYLISTLRSMESDCIRIRFADKRRPIILLPTDENASWLFLLNPVLTN
ncbi:DNA polymerase III subunit beta [Paenibacillus sp. JCM 10914]|nr:DNA polymerase III beta subunit [Paenibacillus sp. JCM 10914]